MKIIMKMEMKNSYMAPEIVIFTMVSESVLCQSGFSIGNIQEEDASSEIVWGNN